MHVVGLFTGRHAVLASSRLVSVAAVLTPSFKVFLDLHYNDQHGVERLALEAHDEWDFVCSEFLRFFFITCSVWWWC